MESCVADEGIPNVIGLFRHLAAGHVALGRGGSSLDNNAEHCCLKGIGDVHESDPNAHIFVIIFFYGLLTPKFAAGKIIW